MYSNYQQSEGTMMEKLFHRQRPYQIIPVKFNREQLYPALSESSVIRINTAYLNDYPGIFWVAKKVLQYKMKNDINNWKAKAKSLIKIIKGIRTEDE